MKETSKHPNSYLTFDDDSDEEEDGRDTRPVCCSSKKVSKGRQRFSKKELKRAKARHAPVMSRTDCEGYEGDNDDGSRGRSIAHRRSQQQAGVDDGETVAEKALSQARDLVSCDAETLSSPKNVNKIVSNAAMPLKIKMVHLMTEWLKEFDGREEDMMNALLNKQHNVDLAKDVPVRTNQQTNSSLPTPKVNPQKAHRYSKGTDRLINRIQALRPHSKSELKIAAVTRPERPQPKTLTKPNQVQASTSPRVR